MMYLYVYIIYFQHIINFSKNLKKLILGKNNITLILNSVCLHDKI